MHKLLSLTALLLSCTGPSQDTADTGTDWTPPQGGRIEVQTEDELTLVADYYPAQHQGRPAILLLHDMYGRHDWPLSFIDRLHRHDWTVLVPDLRGNGESEGERWSSSTVEALMDLAALTRMLEAHGYADIAILTGPGHECLAAAFAYQASTMGEAPVPVALGYLSPGDVEAYVKFDLVPVLPSVFANGPGYSEWTTALQEGPTPDSWVFFYYDNTNTWGTQMFPQVHGMGRDLESFYVGLWPD